MDATNDSVVSEFVLIGLSNSWKMHHFLFWFFSVFYMGIILGNLLIVFTVIIDSHLHAPMYFLLANLSLLDLGLSSTTVPKMISDLFTDCNIISFPKCMIQIFFIHVVGRGEMVLLIAMAYDRYTAICKPLHYLTIMSPKMCVSFVVVAWIVGIIHAVPQFVFVINFPFCGPNEVDSFYCDFPRVMKLACVDTYKLEFVIIANRGSLGTHCVGLGPAVLRSLPCPSRASQQLAAAGSLPQTLYQQSSVSLVGSAGSGRQQQGTALVSLPGAAITQLLLSRSPWSQLSPVTPTLRLCQQLLFPLSVQLESWQWPLEVASPLHLSLGSSNICVTRALQKIHSLHCVHELISVFPFRSRLIHHRLGRTQVGKGGGKSGEGSGY